MPIAKLRQDTIRSLPYGGANNSQWIFWDASLPGFGVRVFPNGRKSYVCCYRVQRRKRLATLGRADVLTLEQARRKARGYLGQVSYGEDPKAITDTERAACTVKALVQTYLDRHAKPKKRSWKRDESLLTRVLISDLGARLANSLTSADIAKIHSEVGRDRPYAANEFLAVVKKMYNVGKTWGLVARDVLNPAAGIERFPAEKRRRYVTLAEMPRLAAALDADINDYAAHAVWLLLLTGLRRSEILGAKWSDIDWQRRTLHIGKTKNGEALLAPLSHAAITRLKRIPKLQGNEHIICGQIPGQPLAYIDSAWHRILKRAALNDLRIHDLRRTVASWLVQDGASLHLVGSVLNHKDPKTTAGYAYFQTQERHRALDQHGANVLAASVAKDKTTVSGEDETSEPYSSRGPMTLQVQRLSREELYARVWSEPISKLAMKLGISDVGLAKACRRANVPVPERGYWARLAAGQRMRWTPLPQQEEGMPHRVKFKVRSAQSNTNWAGVRTEPAN
jgi:integrase